MTSLESAAQNHEVSERKAIYDKGAAIFHLIFVAAFRQILAALP